MDPRGKRAGCRGAEPCKCPWAVVCRAGRGLWPALVPQSELGSPAGEERAGLRAPPTLGSRAPARRGRLQVPAPAPTRSAGSDCRVRPEAPQLGAQLRGCAGGQGAGVKENAGPAGSGTAWTGAPLFARIGNRTPALTLPELDGFLVQHQVPGIEQDGAKAGPCPQGVAISASYSCSS